MYSEIIDGYVLDWNYKKYPQSELNGYVFLIGDIQLGYIFKNRNGWCAVSIFEHYTLCPLDGFKTRFHASNFLLKLYRNMQV